MLFYVGMFIASFLVFQIVYPPFKNWTSTAFVDRGNGITARLPKNFNKVTTEWLKFSLDNEKGICVKKNVISLWYQDLRPYLVNLMESYA